MYSRDAAGTAELRDDQGLLEEHWSYMDRFAESMIARGPTLDTGRTRATGSLHVLALPGADAAREFALALQAPDREAVDGLVLDERTRIGMFSEVEIHDWEFGGRR